MQGRKIEGPKANGGRYDEGVMPGDYWSIDVGDGEKWWYACLPSFADGTVMAHHGVGIGISGKAKDPDRHLVVEHDDGTITVSPSILWGNAQMPAHPETHYHGWLEHGIWREA